MKNDAKNDLKLRLRLQDQILTLWEIVRETESYVMFRTSASTNKKNESGGWDSVNLNLTCFAYDGMKDKVRELFAQKQRVKVAGFLTTQLEKRPAMGRNGMEYQETILSNLSLNVTDIEIFNQPEGGSGFYDTQPQVQTAKTASSESKFDDDIPF